MAKHIFITYTDNTIEIANSICEEYFVNSRVKVESNILSSDDIFKMAKRSTTDFFFVINAEHKIDLSKFDFSFVAKNPDTQNVYIWDSEYRVKMYNKNQVMLHKELYSNPNIVDLKKVYKDAPYDIIFLSYDETTADYNYGQLLKRFPKAKRVHGVKGILNAHRAAANISETIMFYAVDADAVIDASFEFNFVPDRTDGVYVWRSINPINNLTYGYGGVKLFPTSAVQEYSNLPIDFTTSVSKYFVPIPIISNITKFNSDPFSTWRSAFRECTKLSSKLIHNQHNNETEMRLNIWCTQGADKEFGEYAIKGAIAGKEYGMVHKDQPDMLGLINDYNWLKTKFDQQ